MSVNDVQKYRILAVADPGGAVRAASPQTSVAPRGVVSLWFKCFLVLIELLETAI